MTTDEWTTKSAADLLREILRNECATDRELLRYIVTETVDGVNVTSYVRVADSKSCGKLVPTFRPFPDRPCKQCGGECSAISFGNHFEVQSTMLKRSVVSRILREWRSGPHSIDRYCEVRLKNATHHVCSRFQRISVRDSSSLQDALSSGECLIELLFLPSTEDVDLMSHSERLIGIQWNESAFGDGCRVLGNRSLKFVALRRSELDARYWSTLRRLDSLEVLDLNGLRVSEAFPGMDEVLDRIRILSVSESGMSEGAEALQLIGPSLQKLDVSRNDLDGYGLIKRAGNWGGLVDLNVAQTRVTDSLLDCLAETSRRLGRLNLNFTNVTWKGLKRLSQMEELWEVSIRGIELTDRQISQLRDFLPQCQIKV